MTDPAYTAWLAAIRERHITDLELRLEVAEATNHVLTAALYEALSGPNTERKIR